MKATGLLWDDPGFSCAWARLTRAFVFKPLPRDGAPARTTAPSAGLFDRLDYWFWQQEQRQREAYLAQASDIYDLERRMRQLERCGSNGLFAA
jgi:Protein of unknown function (DUF3563)